MIQKILDFFAGDELDALDVALCCACTEGRMSWEDAAAYNRHAFECQQAGIRRKNWDEFFNSIPWNGAM